MIYSCKPRLFFFMKGKESAPVIVLVGERTVSRERRRAFA
jgi:hypothetical protein